MNSYVVREGVGYDQVVCFLSICCAVSKESCVFSRVKYLNGLIFVLWYINSDDPIDNQPAYHDTLVTMCQV